MGPRPVEDATVTVKEIGSTPSSRLEHGSVVDEETAGRMRERGVYLVPTMFVYVRRNERQGTRARYANFIQCKTAGVLNDSREALYLTLAIHVPIAAGTGCIAPGHPHSTLP
jgi:hypothetical protein